MNREEFTIWFAGFFDGEGSIRVQRVDGPKANMRSPSFRLSIRVSNTNKDAICLVASNLGGAIWRTRIPSERSRTSVYYNWQITGYKAGNVLQAIEPYLVVKKQQAHLAIRFQDEVNLHKYRYGHGILLPEEVIAQREQLRIEIGEFNRFGYKKIREVIYRKSTAQQCLFPRDALKVTK